MDDMDEGQAKGVLEAAATEPAAEPAAPAHVGVIDHVRNVIANTAHQLGADFEHVKDMVFKHL